MKAFAIGEALASPFDRRALWTYRLIGTELLAAAILLPALGFRLTPAAAVALPLWAFLLCFAAMLIRRYGFVRFSGCMEATALTYGQGFAILFLLFPLTALSGPLADDSLAAIDRALGFDWPGFAHLFANHRSSQAILKLIYNSFAWQPLLVILALSGNQDRLWRFVTAGTIAGLLTIVIYPLAPAAGAFVHYRAQLADFPTFAAATEFGPVIDGIKSGAIRTIGPRHFVGFVSFPSLHAASAVLFAWAIWPSRLLRWPLVVLNALMCLAAVLVGGHYLTDIIAGTLVAIGSILATRWMPIRN